MKTLLISLLTLSATSAYCQVQVRHPKKSGRSPSHQTSKKPARKVTVPSEGAAAPAPNAPDVNLQAVQTPYGPILFDTANLSPDQMSKLASQISDIAQFYSQRFGPPGNAPLRVVEVADPSAADEAPGSLNLSTEELGSGDTENLLVEKLAHVWWGEGVKPKDGSAAWLTDGLARYSRYLYAESKGDPQTAQSALSDLAVGALAFKEERPLRELGSIEPATVSRGFGADRAAMVLHMLRRILGDQAFFGALTALHRDFSDKPVSTLQFESEVQTTTAKSIAGYVATWVNSTGLPEFKLDYTVYRTKTGYRVSGKISQPLHILQVPVQLKVTEENGQSVREPVEVAGNEVAFEDIHTPDLPTDVNIETDGILFKNPALQFRALLLRGTAFLKSGSYQEAQDEFNEALDIRPASSLLYFRIGESYFLGENYTAAGNSFYQATRNDKDHDPAWAVAWSYVYLGKLFDLTDQRDRALQAYARAVETDTGNWGAAAEAQKYMGDPQKAYKSEESPAPVEAKNLPEPSDNPRPSAASDSGAPGVKRPNP